MSRAGGKKGGAGKVGFSSNPKHKNETPEERAARIKANKERKIREWEDNHPGQKWADVKAVEEVRRREAAVAHANLKKEEAIEEYLYSDKEAVEKKSEKDLGLIYGDGSCRAIKDTILQKANSLYRKYAHKFRIDNNESKAIEEKYRAYKDGSSKDYSLDNISEELKSHKQKGDKIRGNIMEDKELQGMSNEAIYLIIDVISLAAIDYTKYNPDGRGIKEEIMDQYVDNLIGLEARGFGGAESGMAAMAIEGEGAKAAAPAPDIAPRDGGALGGRGRGGRGWS